MTKLTQKSCLPCEGGIPELDDETVQNYLSELEDWVLSDSKKEISKSYSFKNFYRTMSFVNAVAWIANQQGHHPDLEVGYNYCKIRFMTHAINGLTDNDFICAAFVDKLGK